MTKVITIKLVQTGPTAGPFNISDTSGNIIAENVSKKALIAGVSYTVDSGLIAVILTSIGKCNVSIRVKLETIELSEYQNVTYKQSITGCLWRHLTNIEIYNYFYGHIEPYIIEYPFAYQFQDEILQNVKDYTKAYEYLPIPDGVFNYNTRIETNTKYFNKSILYNGQQSSGVLKLVAKPLHNMQAYMQYPKFNIDSKTITYTKSDNFYQYNTFWALQKSSQVPLFNVSCESLSIDKIVNQANMDYGSRSFKKAPLRAKELKIRHILDNSNTTHLVSQFITSPSQISYK
mgnify:CR=1 FL=1|tara:strand:- start:190 stop:1056 length:867 start_codon:yes stop_codon:yes gene_type:complete